MSWNLNDPTPTLDLKCSFLSVFLNYAAHAAAGLKISQDEILFSGDGLKRSSHSSSRSGSRKNRAYSIGLGRSQSGGMSEEIEDVLLPNSRLLFFFILGSHFSLGEGAFIPRSISN